MRVIAIILPVVLTGIIPAELSPQDNSQVKADTFNLGGQLSAWVNYNFSNPIPFSTGGRYLPALNYGIRYPGKKLLDIEVSANIYGTAGFHPFDTSFTDGALKPYRFWARYSSSQFEIRLGLQKINFGSASMLRPLMWFDQIDPRDPLQLTDGVWGLLARYYFPDNTNIWLWVLYGNKGARGWESVPVNKKIPELGGRLQIVIPGGEAGFTYHHRVADSRGMDEIANEWEHIPENKFGIDAKWDLLAGLWIEGSFTSKRKYLGIMTNQLLLNAGIDYTFGMGNGLYISYEHLLVTDGAKPFEFENRMSFSALSANYPVGLFDKFGAMIFYNWTSESLYSFISWQRQFDNIVLYLIGFLNPDQYQLPSSSGSSRMFAGKGLQIMFVFNH